MTKERLNELVRQSKSQAHLDYLLGRETAIGINWTRGFVEYVNAWRVINA